MATEGRQGLAQILIGMRDSRQAGKVEHALVEMLVVAVCAVLSGADDFVEIEAWGKAKLGWLRQYLGLTHGIASHDTFGRLFAAIDAEEFGAAFRRWAGAVLPTLDKDEMASVDGKASRRAGALGATPLHLVSAFAANAALVLGQRATAGKSNDKTVIPDLLLTLVLEGCIVTIDAMGTQASIAATIRSRKADYILAVKDNQPKLAESIEQFWADFQRAPRKTPTASTRRSRRATADSKCAAAMPSSRSTVCMRPSAGPNCVRSW